MPNPPAVLPAARLANGRFGAGNSGRPRGSRNRVASRVATMILEDFEAHHEAFLTELREEDPSGYLHLITTLMPKTVEMLAPDFSALTADQVAEKVSDLRIALDLIEEGSATLLDVEAVLLSEEPIGAG